jgi:hypothetical protein
MLDMFVIFVNEHGIPIAPQIEPADIPADAIWLPKFEL